MPPFCEQNISYHISPICKRARLLSYGGETANYKEFCYIIKLLIIDYQLYTWKKNQNLDFNETLKK